MFTELSITYGGRYFLYDGLYHSKPYSVASISTFIREFIDAGMPEASIERRKDQYMGFQTVVIKQSPEVDAIFEKLVQEKHGHFKQEQAYYAEHSKAWREKQQEPCELYDDLP